MLEVAKKMPTPEDLRRSQQDLVACATVAAVHIAVPERHEFGPHTRVVPAVDITSYGNILIIITY